MGISMRNHRGREDGGPGCGRCARERLSLRRSDAARVRANGVGDLGDDSGAWVRMYCVRRAVRVHSSCAARPVNSARTGHLFSALGRARQEAWMVRDSRKLSMGSAARVPCREGATLRLPAMPARRLIFCTHGMPRSGTAERLFVRTAL